MSECDCPLMLVHCDMEDPVCNQHDDELPDDDPWYEPPPGPMRCDGPLKSRCFDLFCREVGCVEMPPPAAARAGLLRDFEDEERREQERSGRAHMDAGRFLERLVKEHGIKKIAFAGEAEMRAVCRSNRGVYSHYYEGVGVTLADALADLLGYLERAKQQEGVN